MTYPFKRRLWIGVAVVTLLACNLVESATEDNKLVTEDRPGIVLYAPANGNVYAAGALVTFHAEARDLGSGITRIEFTIDVPGQEVKLVKQADSSAERYQAFASWQAFGSQSYLVTARAYRDPGTPDDPSDDVPSNTARALIEVRGGTVLQPSTPAADDSITPEAVTTEETPVSAPNSLENVLPSPGFPGTINAAAPQIPVRQGPSPNYITVLQLDPGSSVEIVGRSEDSAWYVIRVASDAYGWVLTSFVDATLDISALPVIAAPPRQ